MSKSLAWVFSSLAVIALLIWLWASSGSGGDPSGASGEAARTLAAASDTGKGAAPIGAAGASTGHGSASVTPPVSGTTLPRSGSEALSVIQGIHEKRGEGASWAREAKEKHQELLLQLLGKLSGESSPLGRVSLQSIDCREHSCLATFEFQSDEAAASVVSSLTSGDLLAKHGLAPVPFCPLKRSAIVNQGEGRSLATIQYDCL